MNDTLLREDEAWKVSLIRRLERLADIIFALAMILMALTIDLPTVEGEITRDQVNRYLADQLPAFLVYAITFALLAVYWLKHLEHFTYLRRTNTTHIWLQVPYLAALVVIPYSVRFTSEFPDNFAVQTFYSVNMILIGVFSFLSWVYASRDHRLIREDAEHDEIVRIGAEALVEPTVALLSIAAAWFSPVLWDITLMLIPLAYVFQKRILVYYKRRKAAKRAVSQS